MLSEWQPTVSGTAELKLSSVPAGRETALQLDFDFKDGGGFVVAKRLLSRSMPEDYAVLFRMRGRGAVINLELKLVDPTGRNVWRHVIKDLRLPVRWKGIKVESRDIDFAWGPAGSGGISQLGSLEIAIVSSVAAGGTVWIADLRIVDSAPSQAPRFEASSELPDFEASKALADPGWKPRQEDQKPWIVIDFTEPRRLGGLIIDWLVDAPGGGFRVRGSMSGRRFATLYTATAAGGRRSYVYLPGTKVRYFRLELEQPSAGAVLRLQSFEFSRSIDAFWHSVAAAERRGWHPRWLHREQTLWTPIGTSHGLQCALMNGDGMVEVNQGSYSIEPMLWIKERLFTWSDVTSRQELLNGYLPVPSAIWETPEWRLLAQAEATVSGVLRVRYRVENLTGEALSARLFVLLRPFQVTPPWQSFRGLGGVSPVRDLSYRDGAVRVNDTTLIVPAGTAAGFGALSFDEGFMAAHLADGMLPANSEVHDPFGFATGALAFDLSPQAHQACESIVSCMPAAAAGARIIDEPPFDWAAKLPLNLWTGTGWIADVIAAAYTATAHMLVTRSGPALQPGPRRYTRSWIRDGAMMSAALLRMGHAEEVREFIRWYAPHQRADGFVPCCVDREGIDWLVEHDSHGQLAALIADYHRFTQDTRFLEENWRFIEKAVGCIEGLLEPNGLLPISVSHEGYLAQPVHSYWDDFWALRGLRDAADMALALRREHQAQHWKALAGRFAASLIASIDDTRVRRELSFIPGSVEWADFDPTATANALYLFDVPEGLDRKAVDRTFDMYLEEWRRKRSGAVESANYTPYEIRIIGAFVRLGRRDAALELLRFFLSDRRPRAWNQWPEIAWRDLKAPAHIGDLPHTWIAGEYVLAVRSLFAYEREADQSLILAAGLAPEWIEGAGVRVNGMPTLRGALSYSLRRVDGDTLRCEIGGGITGKIVLRPPLAAPLRSVMVDGAACTSFDAYSVTVPHAPAQVTCTT
jgi:hypothetical protein